MSTVIQPFVWRHGARDLEPESRLALCAFGSTALAFLWVGHSLALFGKSLADIGFVGAMAASWSALVFPVLPVILCVFAAAVGLLYHAELRISTVCVLELATFGVRCVTFGIVITAATAAGGIALTLWQPGLLNAWDQAFLWIAIGFQYIGVFLYLYYSVPLGEWASGSHSIQVKQLELIWDQQKMLLRAFFVLIVTVLVGQVFGVMRLKYGNIWEDATRVRQETPHILLSAAQLAFLVLEWWTLVLARVLRRMEQVLLRLGELTEHA